MAERRSGAGKLLPHLPPHGLNENGEVQLAPPRDLVAVGAIGLRDLEGDVPIKLLEEAVADHAGGQELALPSGERGFVDSKGHPDRGLLDGNGGERRGGFHAAFIGNEGVPDRDVREAAKHDDLAGLGLVDLLLAQVVEDEELGSAHVLRLVNE